MSMNDTALDGNVFKLAPGDIDHLFKTSGLSGNKLSPFKYDAMRAASSTPSPWFKVLAESPQFDLIAKRLLEPGVKLAFNSGGNGSVDDRYYVMLSSGSDTVLGQFINSEGDLLILLYPDWKAFLEWWTSLYASTGMGDYQTVFPDVMEIEVLVCALHSVDVYRRAYMESMLDYRSELGLSLTTRDFVELLKRALASRDKRWLLPTMFELSPGLKNNSIALKPEHIKKINELGFITSDETVFTLDERTRIMGIEFISTWMGAMGWQATALMEGEERSLSSAFLAPTGFANHLFLFETGNGQGLRFRHQAISRPELIQTLMEWMKTLRETAGIAPAKPAGDDTGQTNCYCGQCGSEIRVGKKFCSSCGAQV